MSRRGIPPLDESKIVSSRPVNLPAGAYEADPEGALLLAIQAVGLPEPVREWHFMWCCPHSRVEHREHIFGEDPSFQARVFGCALCHYPVGYVGWKHAYDHSKGWRFDFAWLERKLAVEVEGGTWSEGRHVQGSGFEEDCRKYAEAVLRGWKVLRVTSGMVESGEALELVERALGE